MNTRAIFLAGLCLLLLAGPSFPQAKKKAQRFSEMTVSPIKLLLNITTGTIPITPSPDSTMLVVKSTVSNLSVTSTSGESSVKKGRGSARYIVLSPGSQTLYFNAGGYKQVERENVMLAKNCSYEVEVSPKGKFPWMWVGLGTVAAGGGAYLALSGGGGGTPQTPIEKLPDPPGGPTGN